MKKQKKNTGFKMAGTEGTFKYKVPVVTPLGRLGYRNLGGGRTRVRIEPANASVAIAIAANFGDGWRKGFGGGVRRFSLVTSAKADRIAAIDIGLKAIGAMPGDYGVRINSKAPQFVRRLILVSG